MSTQTSNPLDFMVDVVTGFGVGTFGSKIFSDTTQPYRGGEVMTAYIESVKVTESALHATVGVLSGAARKEAYASDLFERRTPVAGLGVGLPTDVLMFARVDRSWPGSAVLVDVSGRSRHAVSDADFAVVGGGRISFNGGAFDSLSTPHDADHAVEQPRIEAKVRLSFDDDLVLVDKDSYKLEVDGDTLVYTYTHSGGTEVVTSEPLRQHGFRPRQDLIVGVEHLVQTGDTRIRFLTSTDDLTFNPLGQDQFAGAEHTVVLDTDPMTIGPGVGEVFWVRVKDAESGVTVVSADLADVPAGATAWGSATGESWLLSHATTEDDPEVVSGGAASLFPSILRLPGTAGAYVSTPSLGISGDIDVRVYNLSADDLANGAVQTIVGEYGTTGNHRAWRLTFNSVGEAVFAISHDGSTTSTIVRALAGVGDGDVIEGIRAKRVSATGVATIERMIDGAWVQLGAATAIGTPGAPLHVWTTPLGVGARLVSENERFAGTIGRIEIRDNINGALAASPDFVQQAAGAAVFDDDQGNTWTVNGGAALESVRDDLGSVSPADWGLNLKGDVIRIPSAIEFESAVGGTVIVSIDTTQHPASDTVLFAHDEQPNQFSVVHTATGKLRVRLGESLYETPAVLGETAITVAFDGTGVDVLANEVAFEVLSSQALPAKVLVAPSRSGTGSADDADYLFTGIAMLSHRATAAERQALAGALVA